MVQPFDYMHNPGLVDPRTGLPYLTLQNYAARPDSVSGNPASLINTLLAQPFWTGDEPLSITALGINCLTAGTTLPIATLRIAVYDVPSTRNLYPGNLLHDFGVVDYAATGVRLASLSVTLPAGKMFWIVTNTPGGTGQHVSAVSSNEITLPSGPLGIVVSSFASVSNQAAFGLSFAATYVAPPTAMPAAFPAGAVTRNNQFGVYPAIVIEPA
jgi:hypothetical protein